MRTSYSAPSGFQDKDRDWISNCEVVLTYGTDTTSE